jgi:hypothetical protein
VRHDQQLYLFEFKVVELDPDGSALQQIKDRGYADKYRAEGLPMHLIGIEFSRSGATSSASRSSASRRRGASCWAVPAKARLASLAWRR